MKIFTKSMVMAILLAGLMSFVAKATVLTTYSTDDAYIKNTNKGKYTGTNDAMRIDSDGTNIYSSVVQFALPDLGGEIFQSATMRLFTTVATWAYVDQDGQGVPVSAYRLGSAWSESNVTWKFPDYGWAVPGTLGTASTPTDTVITSYSDPGHWEEFNVTADVADMYLNGGNHGWALRTESGNRTYFQTRQGTPAPELVVTTAPIPEPGSLFLLGTGLLSLVSFVRRKRIFS